MIHINTLDIITRIIIAGIWVFMIKAIQITWKDWNKIIEEVNNEEAG